MRLRWKIALLAPLAALLPMLMGPTGGMPSRPTFQQVTVGASSIGNSAYRNAGAAPGYSWTATGAAANAKLWDMYTDATCMHSRTINDALSVSSDWFTTCRSGQPLTSLTFGNATDNPSYTLLGTGAVTFGSIANAGEEVFQVNTGAAGRVSIQANANTIEAVCLVANASASASGCGMPAGLYGLVTIGSHPIELHASVNVSGASATFPSATTFSVGGVSLLPATTTATGTAVGLTTSPTTTFRFVKNGLMAVMSFDGGLSGTSNSTSFTATGAVPAAFQPTRQQTCFIRAIDNGATLSAVVTLSAASSTVTFVPVNATALWTASGTKGADTAGGGTCAYALN